MFLQDIIFWYSASNLYTLISDQNQWGGKGRGVNKLFQKSNKHPDCTILVQQVIQTDIQMDRN